MAERCSIYLLRVPEFEALAKGLASTAGVSIAERGDYYVAESSRDIVLNRKAVGVGQAVWFGALTGGIAGRIVEFSEQTLHLAPLTPTG
jgi:hypothetical protein